VSGASLAAPVGETHRIVTLAGHVDHGKSTLLSRLTGMRTDRLEEERRRGLTIDLGFVWMTLGEGGGSSPLRVAFVDVPGHDRFVSTMIAGTGCSTMALVVVAADEGVRAQTVEHCEILDLLGVPAAAIVITKCALVQSSRINEVSAQVERLVSGTSLAGAPVVTVDAVTGQGVDRLGATLHAALSVPIKDRAGEVARLWVDRAFVSQGAGTVVTGTLTEGTLTVGDRARILPSGAEVRIRGLQRLGRPVDRTTAGMRVAVNLTGIHHDRLRRGDVLTVGSTARAITELDVVARVPEGRRLERSGTWRAHVGTAGVACELRPYVGSVEGPGVGAFRLILRSPLPLRLGDRVVLREEGRRRNAAGGVVADIDPPRVRGRDARLARATLAEVVGGRLAGGDLRAALVALLELTGGVREEALLRAAFGSDALPDGGVLLGSVRVLESVVTRWETDLVSTVEEPTDRAELDVRMRQVGVPDEAMRELLSRLVERRRLTEVGGRFTRPVDADETRAGQEQRQQIVLARLMDDAFSPPDFGPIAREVGMDHLERQRLLASDSVVRTGDIVFAAAAIRRATEHLAALEAEHGPFTAAEARTRLGTTRRYVIPLLEHLARTGVTTFAEGRHAMRRVSP
jgi:selenocysteine-specific elongation factor